MSTTDMPCRPSDINTTDMPCRHVEPSDSDMSTIELPCKPVKPSDSDCCGSGCIPCVFDIYDQEVKIWEQECTKIQNKFSTGDDNSKDDILSELEYRKFCLVAVFGESADTNRYRFRLPYNRDLGLKIGQHIIIREKTKNDSITRQYTPVSDVTCTGYFDLLIKIYRDGKMSKVISGWRVGDLIEVRGPFGSLEYSPGKYKSILMLAAGTGIAPMVQVIQGVLNNEDDETMIQLLYACQKYQDILMKKELDEWSSYWNFSVSYVLSQENDGKYKYGDRIFKQKIDETLIKEELDGKSREKSFVLICGPRSFDIDMMAYSKNMGFHNNQIFKF